MSAILSQLRQDHRNMGRLLDLLEQEVGDLTAGADHDYTLMADIVDYFNHYPTRFHHPYEDKIFDWISDERPGLANLVESLRAEHGTLAELGGELSIFLKAIAAGHMVPREQVVERLTSFMEAQRNHIDKEEDQLLKELEALLADHHLIEIPIPDRAGLDPLFGDAIDRAFSALADTIER